MSLSLAFLGGIWIGFLLGFFFAAIFHISKREDEMMENDAKNNPSSIPQTVESDVRYSQTLKRYINDRGTD